METQKQFPVQTHKKIYALDLDVILKTWNDFLNKIFSDYEANPRGYIHTKHSETRFDSPYIYDFPALIRQKLEAGSTFEVSFRDHIDYTGGVTITREPITIHSSLMVSKL